MHNRFLILGLVAGVSTPAAAVESTSKAMSFEACLAAIRQISGDLGIAPINIVETEILRMVRFPTADGSVLVTCSRPDSKLVITRSP